jgi:tRNA (guanine37-N1)-methyltransferase
MSEDIQKYLDEKKLKAEEISMEIGYEHLSIAEILRKILPEEVKDRDIPSGYELVGDIAHMNLTGKLFDFRYAIG